MHARLAALGPAALLALPSSAAAQGDSEAWAAGTGGHLAFLTQSQEDGIAVLRMIGPDGQRSAPEPVSSGSANPIAAVGPRGDALLLWYDGDDRLWARYRGAAGVLGGPELVAEHVDTSGGSNDIGLDAAGTATVTFVPEAPNESGDLLVRTRTEAGVWSAPQNLGGDDVFAPHLAVTPNGSAVLAWRQSGDPKQLNADEVVVSTRPPGGAAFGPVTRVAGWRRNPSSPTVAANDRGDAVVGWSDLHEPRSTFSVHARFRLPGGSFGPALKLNRTRDMAGPYAAVSPSGRIVLGWTDHTKRRAEARVRLASGKLGPARKVTEDLEENSDLFPLAAGRGALAWADRDPDVSTLRIAYTTADGRFQTPRTIARARGWTVGPAFAAGPLGPVVVPKRPLQPDDPIQWRRVP